MRRTLLPTLLALTAAACSEPLHPGATLPGGPVAGFRVTVADAGSRQAIEGVQVRLVPRNPADSGRWTTLTSGPTGEVVFGDIAPGSYEMLARRIGYASERRTVEIGRGAASVDVRLGVSGTGCGMIVTSAANERPR